MSDEPKKYYFDIMGKYLDQGTAIEGTLYFQKKVYGNEPDHDYVFIEKSAYDEMKRQRDELVDALESFAVEPDEYCSYTNIFLPNEEIINVHVVLEKIKGLKNEPKKTR